MDVDPAQATAYIVNPLTGRKVQFANLFIDAPADRGPHRPPAPPVLIASRWRRRALRARRDPGLRSTAVRGDRRGAGGVRGARQPRARTPGSARATRRVIFLVSLAGLLLEVGYTRIVSYKLWYYYTYLVIGLALLGIGSGGIFVVVFPRLRRAATDAIIAWCSILGAVEHRVGYLVVARIPIDTVAIWDYGTKALVQEPRDARRSSASRSSRRSSRSASSSRRSSAAAATASAASTSPTSSAPASAASLAIPLIARLGPPQVVMLVGADLRGRRPASRARAASVLLGIGAAVARRAARRWRSAIALPDVRTETTKADAGARRVLRLGPGVPGRRGPAPDLTSRQSAAAVLSLARRHVRLGHPRSSTATPRP